LGGKKREKEGFLVRRRRRRKRRGVNETAEENKGRKGDKKNPHPIFPACPGGAPVIWRVEDGNGFLGPGE